MDIHVAILLYVFQAEYGLPNYAVQIRNKRLSNDEVLSLRNELSKEKRSDNFLRNSFIVEVQCLAKQLEPELPQYAKAKHEEAETATLPELVKLRDLLLEVNGEFMEIDKTKEEAGLERAQWVGLCELACFVLKYVWLRS